MVKIAPSILSADFARLADEIVRLENAGADWIHIDVMDGHFVPNLTLGAPVVDAIRKVTRLPLDVHLMVTNPAEFVDSFAAAGADILTVHVETEPHLHRLIHRIRERGMKPGVALNPATSLGTLDEILSEVDMVLLMSVNPGFGGQKFINSSLEKIRRLKSIIQQRALSTLIEVDGGVNAVNAPQIISGGADALVAGSAVFGSNDLREAIDNLRYHV